MRLNHERMIVMGHRNINFCSWQGKVIILRTNVLSDRDTNFARQLNKIENSFFIIVADETKGLIECPEFNKVSLTENEINKLGLIYENDTPWRCGDYFFYAARRHFPNAAQFWIIEPDVHIHFDQISSFFSEFDAFNNVDMIATRYSQAHHTWSWYRHMMAYHNSIYTMMFPIVRLSGRAIDYLVRRRISLGKHFDKKIKSEPIGTNLQWPNDESFVATELSNANFLCRDMNTFGKTYYDNDSFNFQKPIVPNMIPQEPDELVRHPIVYGDKMYAQSLNYLNNISHNGQALSENDLQYTKKLIDYLNIQRPEKFDEINSYTIKIQSLHKN